jgi:hypothetical protein
MRTRQRRVAGGAVALVLASAALAGCGESETQGEAESAVCGSVTELREAVSGLGELNADSTGEEAKAAVEEVRDALGQVRTEAQDVQDADAAAVEAAVDEVSDNVNQLDDSSTIDELAEALRAVTAPLDPVISQINDGLGCP